MDDLENAVSLQEFVATLPVSSLPRIIKIASGVYLQSSVYDISGSECCLSTGDLVKVIGKELQSVSCVDLCTGAYQLLPKNFPGQFEILVDNCVYDTLEKLQRALSCGAHIHLFWFASHCDIKLGDCVIKKNHPIQYVPSDVCKNPSYATCFLKDGSEEVCVKIPFSTQGEFYEYKSKETYTLGKVLESPDLLKRNLKCSRIGNGPFNLFPVYEIKTIMQMRKDIVNIPSSLEVDVIDITSEGIDINFIRPLSLIDASECKDQFPVVAEILDTSESNHLLKNDLFSSLRKGQKLVIYQKTFSRKVLASATKGKVSRFFYIHDVYQGKFRQRPREFPTVYDLWTTLTEGGLLNVVVTQDCESVEDGLPSLSIGDHLKVLYQTKRRVSADSEENILVCRKDSDDDEEEPEEIMLPLYMQGRFVEEAVDNKKYALSNIIQKLKLPCEVKVVTKDASLTTDPLTSFASLKLEELIEEPVLVVSYLDKPSDCFEIPIKWLEISLVFLEEPVPATKELTSSLRVEELSESFYYGLRRELPTYDLPPPRPPKREGGHTQSVHTEKKKPAHIGLKPKSPVPPDLPSRKYSEGRVTKSLQNCTLQSKNTYSPTPRKSSSENDSDNDHDYESIDPEKKKLQTRHQVI
ncbi:protein THEMIS2 isoform 1-T4 [Discoglossus pictus]